MKSTPTLRPARRGDETAIDGLIRELAVFEKLEHMKQSTPERLAEHLFGEKPVAEAWVAEADAKADAHGEVIAFALFFTSYSTFRGQPGLWLEDLYVQPAHRGRGVGKALITRVAQLAVQRGCGRFEWSVLDWNHSAIGFYQSLGASVLPDLRICRVADGALAALGAAR